MDDDDEGRSRQNPKLTLVAQLAYVTEEEGLEGEENNASKNQLSLPVYNLRIEAIDGKENGTAAERQSGVKNIEVKLDGVKREVPWLASGVLAAPQQLQDGRDLSVEAVGTDG